MKGTVNFCQKHPSERFYNGIVLSAIDDNSDVRIYDFSVHAKGQLLPERDECAQILKSRFKESPSKCFSHHPLIASLFLLIAPAIPVLFAAALLPALLGFPVGLLLGWF